jgi:hypothetical protein
MNVAQLLHGLALIAHVAVVVALLPKDAAGNEWRLVNVRLSPVLNAQFLVQM